MISAGPLNKRLTIRQPQVVRSSDTGGIVPTRPEEVVTIMASITPLSSKRTEVARAASIQTTHIIRCRYTSLIDSETQLVYSPIGSAKPRVFKLDGAPINVMEQNRELELRVIEVQ